MTFLRRSTWRRGASACIAARSGGPSLPAVPERTRVLVFERNGDARARLEGVIRARGHAVDAYGEADPAWQAYQINSHSLAILDWTTPDGPGLCRRIRSSAARWRCVVLAANLVDEPAELEEALRTGADDFVTKPAVAGALEARLAVAERQVHQREERARAEAALGASERWFRGLHEAARKRETARLGVSRVLSRSASLAEAAPRVVEAIAGGLGWDAGMVWEAEGERARCFAAWPTSENQARSGSEWRPARGALGTVLRTGQPLWLRAAAQWDGRPSQDPSMPRGMRTALLYPLVAGHPPATGVAVLLAREALERDPAVLVLLEDVSRQIGHWLGCRLAQGQYLSPPLDGEWATRALSRWLALSAPGLQTEVTEAPRDYRARFSNLGGAA